MNTDDDLLQIKNLTIHFITDDGTVHAVNNINLTLKKGQTLGLVGETGAGKTTTALGIMQLVPKPPGEIISGEIIFDGENLFEKSKAEMRLIRGGKISMIFQDPMTSLNPVLTIGEQIAEVIAIHQNIKKADLVTKVGDMLELVGIPANRANEYPHQFSGGMKQRVIIAIALACNPQLLIADEPTTALDVTIQAQVIDLMHNLKNEFNTAMMMITHDLGVVAEICDMVAIMYAGNIIEYATVEQLFTDLKHPYTHGLFGSIPKLDEKTTRLEQIQGIIPDPTNIPTGCPFHPRCPFAEPICSHQIPIETVLADNHMVRCLFYEGLLERESINV